MKDKQKTAGEVLGLATCCMMGCVADVQARAAIIIAGIETANIIEDVVSLGSSEAHRAQQEAAKLVTLVGIGRSRKAFIAAVNTINRAADELNKYVIALAEADSKRY